MAYACEIRNALGIRDFLVTSGYGFRIYLGRNHASIAGGNNTSYNISESFIEELEVAIASITGHTDISIATSVLAPYFYAGDTIVQGGQLPQETEEPITDVVLENNELHYTHIVDGFTLNNHINLPDFRTYWEFLDILREASGETITGRLDGFFLFPLTATAEVEIACLDLSLIHI